MDEKNIMFFENHDKSYTMIDPYLCDGFFGYKNSYNYYDIDVDKILLFKKSDCKYFIRYNDVYNKKVIPLQLRIENFYSRIHTYANNNRVMYIYTDDKELFKKCREIWNRITKLIGINNTPHFIKTALDYGDVIMADVEVLMKVILKI